MNRVGRFAYDRRDVEDPTFDGPHRTVAIMCLEAQPEDLRVRLIGSITLAWGGYGGRLQPLSASALPSNDRERASDLVQRSRHHRRLHESSFTTATHRQSPDTGRSRRTPPRTISPGI